MFTPEAIAAAAAGAVLITHGAFHWAAARSIRRAVDTYTAHLTALARIRANATRPTPPPPPRRPDWARDTTVAMPLVPPPAGGLRGPAPTPHKGG